MYDIAMQGPSSEFLECWKAAGLHLDRQVQDGIRSWLRVDPTPPFLEHISFRLGNQLFFVRLYDVDQRVEMPGSIQGLFSVADGCKGHVCIMPMRRRHHGWVAAAGGWGLVDARTGTTVDPVKLITDEKIEMTLWELQDFAVQVVRNSLTQDGYQLMSWQSNPAVNPSIWFVGDGKVPEWVVVRAGRFPEKDLERPSNWQEIAAHCRSHIGHFAPVVFVSMEQPFLSAQEEPVPLWRGYGVNVCYVGLQ